MPQGASPAAMLYVPGGTQRFVAKAATLALGAVILDLEDSVSAGAKGAARVSARSAVHRLAGAGTQVWVRVNGVLGAEGQSDLDAVISNSLTGVVLPKVDHPHHVQVADRVVRDLEHERGLRTGEVLLLPLIEDVRGLANVDAIAQESPRVYTLGFGAADFAADIGLIGDEAAVGSSPTITGARVAIVLACRNAGLARPHDAAYLVVDDEVGLRAACQWARSIGFGGKHAIHPRQVAAIEEEFRPSESEVAAAVAVVRAANEAGRRGEGASLLNGTMVDEAIIGRARTVLGRAKSVGIEPGDAM